MSFGDALYSLLPVPFQNLAFSAYGVYWYWLRFGVGFRESLIGYIERENFEDAEWKAWQSARLKGVLQSALRSPYYAGAWTPSQRQAAEAGDLSGLPLLEKDPLRQNPRAFVSRPRRDYTFYTSGSTGTPIASIWTAAEIRDSLALREARSALWAGVSFGLPRVTFSGRIVVPNPHSSGPFHRYNMIERQVYFSAFHLRPDTASRYVKALRRHKIEWGTGYAVSFYLLGKFILSEKIEPPKLRSIITTSEKLTPEMRSVIEEAFQCQVFEEYSTVENALFASECEQGRLHVSPDASIVEIIRPDGTPCLPGEVGEVVATCLIRAHQPLIRFRLGDLAAWDDRPCPCGRRMPVIREVVGRIEDVVIGPDGRQMVRFHGVFVNQPHVQEGQVIQESLSQITVRVVPTKDYTEEDTQDIIQRIRQRLGANVDVTVEQVTNIPRTKSGKFQAVISHLKKNG
ncbi:MAG: phenylacetate--CoA ligase family protein [Anaerolineales bacterium]|nr:phenylacetate--CoA ligase family protein [Anaerolineales bacterium]